MTTVVTRHRPFFPELFDCAERFPPFCPAVVDQSAHDQGGRQSRP
jgi:hypothetical protein